VKTPAAQVVSSEALVQLKDAARRVFADQPGFVALYLFGSAARGEPAHDLDVGVLFTHPPSTLELESLTTRLQLEGAPRGPEIDLRLLRGTSPRFRFNVVSEGRLLYEADARERIRFEARAMGDWLDFKPTWMRMRERMLERWTHG
jgi:predicted nucleotidyltransferase